MGKTYEKPLLEEQNGMTFPSQIMEKFNHDRGPSWIIEPTVPDSTPHPTEYWINVWYKSDGTDTWRIISGVEDNTNIGMAIPNDVLYYDFNFIKHPALIYLSSDPEPLHPTFTLEWAENDFLVELDGELRVDVRVQMFYPGSTVYDEHTMGSDYASISSNDDSDDDNIPGFEFIVLFIALGVTVYLIRKGKK